MPELSPEEKERRVRTNKKIFKIFGAIFVCIMLAGMFFSNSEKNKTNVSQSAQKVTPTATVAPMQYSILEKKEEVRAAIKRNRLHVVIAPVGPQDAIAQVDLVAMVVQAAKNLQKESGLPVVSVKMVCQKASNDYGQLMLASAVYIPDGKGYSGSQDLGPWDNLMAAPRGFTDQELEYLRMWADMRGSFQKDGRTDDAALDKAISERMGIAPGSLKPHHNTVERMEVK